MALHGGDELRNSSLVADVTSASVPASQLFMEKGWTL
jgi:hypothetical protein